MKWENIRPGDRWLFIFFFQVRKMVSEVDKSPFWRTFFSSNYTYYIILYHIISYYTYYIILYLIKIYKWAISHSYVLPREGTLQTLHPVPVEAETSKISTIHTFYKAQPQASHHNQNIQKQSWDVHFRAQSRKKTLIIHIYEEHTHSHWPEATCVNTNLMISSVTIDLNNLNNKSEHVLIVGFLCEVFLKQMSLSKNGICPKK
jgi:hypothetical protein